MRVCGPFCAGVAAACLQAQSLPACIALGFCVVPAGHTTQCLELHCGLGACRERLQRWGSLCLPLPSYPVWFACTQSPHASGLCTPWDCPRLRYTLLTGLSRVAPVLLSSCLGGGRCRCCTGSELCAVCRFARFWGMRCRRGMHCSKARRSTSVLNMPTLTWPPYLGGVLRCGHGRP